MPIFEPGKPQNSALGDVILTGPTPPAAFDSITRLAVDLFDVPVALISIVEEDLDRQFFASAVGLPEPWASLKETPLSHSFCQHVKFSNEPLRVADARTHPMVKDNLAIQDLNVIAYLGVPIRQATGKLVGALCIIDGKPREWSDQDVDRLQDLAVCVNDEIALRASLDAITALHAKLDDTYRETLRYNAIREAATKAFMDPALSPEDRFSQTLRSAADAIGMRSGVIAEVEAGVPRILFTTGPKTDPVEPFDLSRSLTGLVLSDEGMVDCEKASETSAAGYSSLLLERPESYIGAPIMINGRIFGVIEFCDPMPRKIRWTEAELSSVNAVTMLCSSYLGLFGYVDTLRQSEAALTEKLVSSQRGGEIHYP